MKSNKIKFILIFIVITFALIFIFVVLDSINFWNKKPTYRRDGLYTFTCYNKNIVIISSYGFGYKNGKIFDSREQKLITLPNDCAVFKFKE
jgi:hypothetical protein